ncbi:MAG: hypothetical protein KF729_31690 [Sandaracinaceae bacterium]|nr:hypothetical protein [Sandaracinaceae bacterium]
MSDDQAYRPHVDTALPTAEDPLTQSQEDVVAKLVGHLVWLASSDPSASLPRAGATVRERHDPATELRSFLFVPDAIRYNQCFLIDGARGSGKTTALIALLDELRHAINAPPIAPPPHPTSARVARAGRLADVAVYPLRILDLRPFPEGRSLVLEIPSALLGIVEHLEARSSSAPAAEREPPASWLGHEHAARTAWRRFARDAALGFARPGSGRAADANAFVEELEEAGARRADVEASFHDLVNATVEALRELDPRRKRPLLVIPIDDADMQPRRCLELLDMLRMLRHPRVAYVLTGHLELFDAVLRDAFRGSLGHRSPPALLTARVPEVSELADTLARQYLDKHLPVTDRATLPPLTPEERLELLLPRAAGDDESGYDALRRRLGLADHLLAQGLPENLREAVSLKAELERLPSRSPALWVKHVWNTALEHSTVTESTRRILRKSVRPTTGGFTARPGVVRLRVTFDGRARARPGQPGALWVQWSPSLHAELTDLSPVRYRPPPSPEVRRRTTVGNLFDQLEPGVAEGSADLADDGEPVDLDRAATESGVETASVHPAPLVAHAEPPLPERLAHAYGLLLANHGDLHEDHARILLADVQRAYVVFCDHDVEGEISRAAWPLPRWRDFETYLQFFHRWRGIAESAEVESPAFLARRYADLLLAVETGSQHHVQVGGARAWSDLIAQLAEVPKGAVAEWCREALFLLALPEAGLDPASANDLLGRLQADEWIPSDAQARRRRWLLATRRVHGDSSQGQVESFARIMDRTYAEHRWSSEYEPGTIREALLEMLGRCSARTESLARLATASPQRRRTFESFSPPALRELREAVESADAREDAGVVGPDVMEQVYGALGGPPPPRGLDDQVMAPVARLVGGPFSAAQAFEVEATTVRLRRRVEVQVLGDSSDEELTPLQDYALRLLWDAHVAAGSVTRCAVDRHALTGRVVPWPGLSVRTVNAARFSRWLLPAYPELYRWERWLGIWRTLREPRSTQAWIDGFALAWIVTVDSEAGRDELPRLRPYRDTPSKLGQLAGGMLSNLFNQHRAPAGHRQFIGQWASVARAFFSRPELSGVSEDFAGALAEVFDRSTRSPEPPPFDVDEELRRLLED